MPNLILGGAVLGDAPRAERRVKLSVDCAVRTQVIAGHLLTEGQNEIVVYESELPAVQALVEPRPDLLDEARRNRAEAIAEWQDEQQQRTGHRPEEWRYDGLYKTASGAFKAVHRRSPRPLRSVAVIEKGLPPPESDAQAVARMNSEQLVDAVGTVIAKLLAAQAQQSAPAKPSK